MNHTPQQFNEMAFFHQEGIKLTQDEIYSDENGQYFHDCNGDRYDSFNDLNVLMPLFWKLGGDFEQFENIDGVYFEATVWQDSECLATSSHEDPVQAIRNCLWSIWQEGNTNG